MNFHEYQAKELFASYGIPVPAGINATTAEEAVAAARELGGINHVYLIPGHSYMDCDRAFGVIEKKIRRTGNVRIHPRPLL